MRAKEGGGQREKEGGKERIKKREKLRILTMIKGLISLLHVISIPRAH